MFKSKEDVLKDWEKKLTPDKTEEIIDKVSKPQKVVICKCGQLICQCYGGPIK